MLKKERKTTMEEQSLRTADEQPTEEQKNPIDEAYMQKIADLEQQIAEQKKDLERANSAFKNLLENRKTEPVANGSEDGFLNSIKRLMKR